jgi:hypothetical protein
VDAESERIKALLQASRTIAVVGLSGKPWRASHGVSRYMQQRGYRIIPVNPNETEVLGERAFARLEQVPEKVDIVNVFRRSEHVPAIAESAIRAGAAALWMQEGVIHAEAAERARGGAGSGNGPLHSARAPATFWLNKRFQGSKDSVLRILRQTAFPFTRPSQFPRIHSFRKLG